MLHDYRMEFRFSALYYLLFLYFRSLLFLQLVSLLRGAKDDTSDIILRETIIPYFKVIILHWRASGCIVKFCNSFVRRILCIHFNWTTLVFTIDEPSKVAVLALSENNSLKCTVLSVINLVFANTDIYTVDQWSN